MTQNKDKFTARLRKRREQTRQTQAEAARTLRCTRQHLCHVEGGDTMPSLSLLLRMSTAYVTTVGSLLGLNPTLVTNEHWLRRVLVRMDGLRVLY